MFYHPKQQVKHKFQPNRGKAVSEAIAAMTMAITGKIASIG